MNLFFDGLLVFFSIVFIHGAYRVGKLAGKEELGWLRMPPFTVQSIPTEKIDCAVSYDKYGPPMSVIREQLQRGIAERLPIRIQVIPHHQWENGKEFTEYRATVHVAIPPTKR